MWPPSLARVAKALRHAAARRLEDPRIIRTVAAALAFALCLLRLAQKRRLKARLTNGNCFDHTIAGSVASCPVCQKSTRSVGKNNRAWPCIRVIFSDGSPAPLLTHLHCARDLINGSREAEGVRRLDDAFAKDLKELLDGCPELLKATPCLRMCHEDWHLQVAASKPVLQWPPEPPPLPPVQSIFSLENVGEMRISSCPLFRTVPADAGRCRGLQTLVFISTGISALPPEMGLLRDLEVLYLNGNFIRSVPESVAVLPNLVEVCLDANQLRDLPPLTSPRLKLFTAPANQLTSIELVHSCTLDRIELHGNSLHTLKMRRLPMGYPSREVRHRDWAKVYKLKLMGNQLSRLPEEIGLMTGLQTLFVSDNNLSKLPESIASLPKLQWLFAYNNLIGELPQGLLLGSSWLETVLLESNPLSEISLATVVEDIPRCTRMKLLGLDADQIDTCTRVFHGWQYLPSWVSVGSMLRISGNSQYYSKLMRASHIKRRKGVPAEGEPRARPSATHEPARLLVVAFAASQGEPEWMGLLSRLATSEKVNFQAPMVGPLEDLLKSVGQGDARSAMLWSGCQNNVDVDENDRPATSATELIQLEDFDVLSLVDHRMRWYAGDEDALQQTLSKLVDRYEHKLFVGASMGGFGALLHAGHLARSGKFGPKDAVVTFGPQAVLNLATLRPPARDVSALEDFATRMKESARLAAKQGAIVEIHCAADEHFGHALAVPLRDLALIAHPLVPRKPFAKLLDRAGLLLPIIGDALARLLTRVEELPPPPSADADPHQSRAVVARWTNPGGQLVRHWTSRAALVQIFFGQGSTPMPRPGDWFCPKCKVRNMSAHFWCFSCGIGVPGSSTIADAGVVRIPDGRTYPRSGDWGCGKCGTACCAYNPTCSRCGTGREAHAKNFIY